MISLSERAANEFRALLDALPEPRPRVRVFVDHRCHCGNVHFSMALEPRASDGDQEFVAAGVPFIADSEATAELPSVEIDYNDSWMQRGFTVRNKNHNCGGGHHSAG
jgi:iron-sulfur cluster assembly accessory protein